MFIRKERLAILEAQIGRLQEENIRQKNKIEKLEEEKQNIKNDLENEHLENYKQHKKLLAIERLLNGNFGSYKDLLQFRNKIKALVNDSQSNN